MGGCSTTDGRSRSTVRPHRIYPGIDGLSGVPSIFEYVGGRTEHPAKGQRLQLLSASQREHGVMWMRYKFHKKLHK